MRLDLVFHIKGSLIEINSKINNDTNELYIFCSTPSNYKLHTIYAFVLDRMGYQVCQIDDRTTKEQLASLFEKIYGESKEKTDEI